MHDFYTPAQLSVMRGGGESTWRLRAARGDFKHAVKQGNTWFIPMYDVLPPDEEECAESRKLSPEYPNDPSSIVLARNSDGRYGIAVSGHWFGVKQALVILRYLEEHEPWLVEKIAEQGE